MLRALRRALLPTLAILLLFASSAAAECAWVVWNQIMSTNPAAPPEGLWQPSESFKTLDQCKTFAEKMNMRGPTFSRDAAGDRYISSNVCLPDTVDPRGPKGGR